MGLTNTTRLVAMAMAGMFAAGPIVLASSQDKPALDTGTRTTVQETPSDPAARRQAAYKLYLEGEQFERAGDYIRAVEAYKQTVELVPEDDQPRVALARLYLSNRNTDAARTAAQDALKFKKNSVPAVRSSRKSM
ncbi:MAG: tetratricopeptide repeat protein [Blastocatellia bacterium]|nr:tetratricopeptide repeat protein [Blastocatellia bacterium]